MSPEKRKPLTKRKRADIRPGVKVGRWKAIADTGESAGGHRYWLCLCDCGTEKNVLVCHLRSGRSAGCSGCKTPSRLTHGHSSRRRGFKETRAYRCWSLMKARCSNPALREYPYYGGRGISVCSRWADSFEAFFEDMGEPPDGMSIDRIDVNGNYEPSNCRWATMAQQQRNKQNTRWVKYRGERLSLADWADRTGIAYSTLKGRLNSGWSVERALTEPRRGDS